MKSHLLMTNIPYDCSEYELQHWVESRGIETRAIRIVRDMVSGVSPAFGYVELGDDALLDDVIVTLNGKQMRGHTILVTEARARTRGL